MAFEGVYYLKEGSLLRKLPSFSEKIARLLNSYIWAKGRGGDGPIAKSLPLGSESRW